MSSDGAAARPALPPGVNFTCMACRVGFALADAHREHFKSDWHRYNLKRKMASMPPVTAVEFRDRLLAQRNAAMAAEAESEDGIVKCPPCGKRFNTDNAFRNHLGSKKHKDAVKAAESRAQRISGKSDKAQEKDYHTVPALAPVSESAEVGEGGAVTDAPAPAPAAAAMDVDAAPAVVAPEPTVADAPAVADAAAAVDGGDAQDDEDEEWEVPDRDVEMTLNDCVFCGTRSAGLEENLNHMSQTHGFFIPDVEHLQDLTGLISYLQDKVSRYHICLTCNGTGKAFFSTEAVRGHMLDKGHCFVAYGEDGQLELEDFYDFGEDDEGWEDVDDTGESTGDGSAAGASKALMIQSDSTKAKGDYELDLFRGAKKPTTVDGSTFEIVLPSGARVGHRSLRRYYRQSFATEDNRDSVVIQKLVSEYSAIGLPGFGPGSGAPTKEIRRDRDHARRVHMNERMRLGMRHNKSSLNKHFREQNTQ
eukprot:m.74536 g.74536  ORF g.74536 m.74536 type:complete len:477 (-) comp18904_c0_seq1:615-2045(-)